MTELERVLAALKRHDLGRMEMMRAMTDAARLLREMAQDFRQYSHHMIHCATNDETPSLCCTCGMRDARARWRLTQEQEPRAVRDPWLEDEIVRRDVEEQEPGK